MSNSGNARNWIGSIGDSMTLKLAVAGIILASLGIVFQEGAVPAFMVIWGTAFFLIGTGSYAVIRFNSP